MLNLDLALYDGWENVVVYPDEFVPGWEWEDEAGVVHATTSRIAGEAMEGGPVILSWADVEASQDWDVGGHEPRHPRIRAQARHAQRCRQRLSAAAAEMAPHVWKKHACWRPTRTFEARVESDERTAIDPYAAESPAEFFAVLSEVFFVDPAPAAPRVSAGVRTIRPLLPAGAGGTDGAAAGILGRSRRAGG